MRKLFTLALGVLFAAGFAQAQPTTVPDPVATGDNAVGIYSTALGNTAGYYFDSWGSTTTGAEETIDSKKVFKMSNFVYYGSQFSTIDATSMTYLHLDVYPLQDMYLTIAPITTGGIEKGVQSSLTANKWNSIDIPVTTLVTKGCKMDKFFQIKYVSKIAADGGDGNVDGFVNGDGTETFYIGNVYLYKENASYDDTEAPVITSATVGEVQFASATISLTATDNLSTNIYYTATDKESGNTYKVTGKAGEATTLNVTGLATGTTYNLSIVAADEKGNQSTAKEVSFTTASLPSVPQPSAVVYKSIYSPYLGNTEGYWFNNWGGGSGAEITIDGKNAYQISNFMYFGSEFTTVSVKDYTYLHLDVLPLNDMTSLCIVPITGTIEKGVNFELTPNKWNSLETTVAAYTEMGCNMANVYQIKYVAKKVSDGGKGLPDGFENGDGTKSFIVGNVYFYTPQNTAVEDVAVATPAEDGPAYNVFGQVVSDDYKGIVIKNGKKEIRK